MIFATYSTPHTPPRPALVKGGRVYPLPFPDMRAVIEAGAQQAVLQASNTPIHIAQVTFHAPLKPTSLRDAYAFEQHVHTANQNRGREIPAEWYKFPVFYYTNSHSIYGPADEIPYPHYTSALDYELEVAVVIGKGGRDLLPENALDHIFGYTIFNDWSARDVQREEMKVGLGPAKGKDFASSLGPYLVTPDEFADRATSKPGVYDLTMIARVNGVELSRGNLKDLYWSFGDIIARASDTANLLPGDVIGSGTVGTGCLLELTKTLGPWLQPGDVVELEVDRIGIFEEHHRRESFMKKTSIVLLAVVLILTACAPSPQPATPAVQNVETIVASTLQALTAAAPLPSSTPQAIGLPVSANNVAFNIPVELNASATPSTNTDVEFPYINPSNGPMPEHVVFQFTNYPVLGDARIMVFKASEYAAYGAPLQDVVSALLAGQDADQPLPKALTLGDFYAQAKPVSFQNGHGVRYLMQVLGNFMPINNQDLFYYYQGITNDGAYFVSAVFHVHAPSLVADGNQNSATPPDGIPFNWGADLDFTKYKADITQKLNDTPAENYAPSLTILDKMIKSLQVTNP